MLETSTKAGIGASLSQFLDRKLRATEIEAGADLLFLGAYFGICPDEFIDFIGAIFSAGFKK